MKLPIAIAVLFLVLAANTEAQEAHEPTLEERFQTFGSQMKALAEGFSEKTKSVFEDIHTSDTAVKARNWFTENFEKAKAKLVETFKQ